MDTELAPIDVANHWPFIHTRLDLDQSPSVELALQALAVKQVDAGGEPVVFGTNYWRGVGLTPGEIGGVTRALLRLEERGVIESRKRRGPVGNAWRFTGSIRRWTGMPWTSSRQSVATAICGCSNRAGAALIALLPGQGIDQSRCQGPFRLPSSFHLLPPGPLAVEMRDPRRTCAISARPPGRLPVEMRDQRRSSGTPFLSVDELNFLKEDEGFASLTQTASDKCGVPIWPESRPWQALGRASIELNPEQIDALEAELRQFPDHVDCRNLPHVLADLRTRRTVKRAGGGSIEGPVAELADSLRA